MSTDNLYKPAPTQRRICDLISVAAWRETGFLRQISVKYKKSRKKPGF